MKVLFVCRGNVARSQFAAALFNKYTEGRHEVSSAGTRVVSKEGVSRDGQKLSELPGAAHVIEILREDGVDAAGNQRTQCNEDMVYQADLVVVMAEPHALLPYLARTFPKFLYWEVSDPKGGDLAKFREVHAEIDKKIRELIEMRQL